MWLTASTVKMMATNGWKQCWSVVNVVVVGFHEENGGRQGDICKNKVWVESRNNRNSWRTCTLKKKPTLKYTFEICVASRDT